MQFLKYEIFNNEKENGYLKNVEARFIKEYKFWISLQDKKMPSKIKKFNYKNKQCKPKKKKIYIYIYINKDDIKRKKKH